MITCREVNKLITSDQLLCESWMKRLQVKLHLLMCRNCSRVMKQLRTLRKAARELWAIPKPSDLHYGDHLELRVLRRLLKTK